MNKKNFKQKSSRRKSNKVKQLAAERNFQDAAALQERDKFSGRGRVSTSNDPKWYFKDAKVLSDVASFSFNSPLGLRVNTEKLFTGNKQSAAFTTIPGLMTLEVSPVPGISTDATSPINIAAQNVYSYVRYKNSGASNYDAPDLMLYLIAMDSAYAMWNWMKRIYGFASTYSSQNRYQPAAYAKANYVDLQDIYAHLADMRAYLNMAAFKLSAFCVPSTMTYMVRHSWLFANIFKDSETRKAQEYMYVPSFFYKYDETSSPKGGILTPVPVAYGGTALTFDKLRSLMDSVINALQYSEDIGIMSGDILKAYGEGSLFTLSTFDADYKVQSAYSKEVLTQFENALYFSDPLALTDANLANFKITQDPDTNWIIFQPTLSLSSGIEQQTQGMYLNMHWDNPTPEDVMVASRINAVLEYTNAGSNTSVTYLSTGSEIALKCCVYWFAQSSNPTDEATSAGSPTLYRVDMGTVNFGNTQTTTETATYLKRLFAALAFDWSPQVYVFWGGDSLST